MAETVKFEKRVATALAQGLLGVAFFTIRSPHSVGSNNIARIFWFLENNNAKLNYSQDELYHIEKRSFTIQRLINLNNWVTIYYKSLTDYCPPKPEK